MKSLLKVHSHAGYSCISAPVPVKVSEGIETWSYQVTTPKRKINGDFDVILIDLYSKVNCFPHGWEATKADTTNESGYYSSGSLQIADVHGFMTLEDFDGEESLPKSLCALLRVLGIAVDDSYLAQSL